jgi:hypothetical protein
MATKLKMKRMSRPDDAEAFIDDVAISHARVNDNDAESFGEEFIATATSAEFIGEDARNELIDEEVGGPYLEVRAMFDDEDLERS